MFVVKKSKHNPILVPDRDHYWEEFATFNLCPIRYNKKVYGLYRAISASDPPKYFAHKRLPAVSDFVTRKSHE